MGAWTSLLRGRTPWRRAAAVILGLALAAPFAGCSSNDPYYSSGSDWARIQEQHVLDVRARAIKEHDLSLFMSTVARGDHAFVLRQRRYFANLIQFPLEKLTFTVTSRSWSAGLVADRFHAAARPRIEQVVELDGFDAHPETSVTGLVLAKRNGQFKVVADRTRGGGFFPGYAPQPWDVAAIHVVRRGDVLGVFDQATAGEADRLLTVVTGAVVDDQSALPFAWPGDVIVYAFKEPALLATFRHVPGGNIADLGALSFPVYANTSGTRIAGMRFIVLPGSLGADDDSLARLVRHELTHVALGPRDDGAPTWFIEGIAEYLASRPLAREGLRIASVAVQRASGPVTSMPVSSTFNGPDQDWHYALSWMACSYIASKDGESRLWDLMDAFHDAHGGTPDSRQDAVLRATIGMDSHALAAHAAARIRSIFG